MTEDFQHIVRVQWMLDTIMQKQIIVLSYATVSLEVYKHEIAPMKVKHATCI